MSFDVVNGEEGFVPEIGERFCGSDAYLERRSESGSCGNSDRLYIIERSARFLEGGFDNGDDIFRMLARGEIGDDAAKGRMERYL